jgi:hypothetical protein
MNNNKMNPISFLVYIAMVTLVFSMTQTIAYGETIQKGIIILVEFPDVRHDVNRDFVQKRFSQHLNDYVKEMSYNTVSLKVDVTKKWYTLPYSVSQYRISSRNLEVDKLRVRKIIDDALNAADKDVDFSKYSFAIIVRLDRTIQNLLKRPDSPIKSGNDKPNNFIYLLAGLYSK